MIETTEQAHAWAEQNISCAVDGCHGIYAPQRFTELYDRNPAGPSCGREDWEIVQAGPDHEHYWEAWESVMDNWRGPQGATIYQDGDVFLVAGEPPEGFWDNY